MDNKEFFEMLKEARRMSGVKMYEVAYKLKKSEQTVINMLTGKTNKNFEIIMDFVQAINAALRIGEDFISTLEEYNEWEKNVISQFSYKDICELLDVTMDTASRLRTSKVHFKTSYFITFINYLHLECQVLPADIPNISQIDDCDID